VEQSEKNGFDQWAIIDLFGHQRIAGHITEAQIAGQGFIRVDVPGPDGETLWSRFLNPSAVYGISPVSMEVALKSAAMFSEPPVHPWELKQLTSEGVPEGLSFIRPDPSKTPYPNGDDE